MGQTPNSTTVPYLSVNEFLAFKDVRAVGMLAVDDGTQATPTQLQTNIRLAAILLAVSGEIESALLSSERYSTTDLAAFNGASQQFLKEICAKLALYELFMARNAPDPPATVLAGYDQAQAYLQMLSSGERILSFVETASAGVPDNMYLMLGELLNLNRFTDRCRRALGPQQDERRTIF